MMRHVIGKDFPGPDCEPGYYYVSVRRDGGDYRLLSGPFPNNHAAALEAVPGARSRAIDLDPRGCWYAYGTCRVESDQGPGILDRLEYAP